MPPKRRARNEEEGGNSSDSSAAGGWLDRKVRQAVTHARRGLFEGETVRLSADLAGFFLAPTTDGDPTAEARLGVLRSHPIFRPHREVVSGAARAALAVDHFFPKEVAPFVGPFLGEFEAVRLWLRAGGRDGVRPLGFFVAALTRSIEDLQRTKWAELDGGPAEMGVLDVILRAKHGVAPGTAAGQGGATGQGGAGSDAPTGSRQEPMLYVFWLWALRPRVPATIRGGPYGRPASRTKTTREGEA